MVQWQGKMYDDNVMCHMDTISVQLDLPCQGESDNMTTGQKRGYLPGKWYDWYHRINEHTHGAALNGVFTSRCWLWALFRALLSRKWSLCDMCLAFCGTWSTGCTWSLGWMHVLFKYLNKKLKYKNMRPIYGYSYIVYKIYIERAALEQINYILYKSIVDLSECDPREKYIHGI